MRRTISVVLLYLLLGTGASTALGAHCVGDQTTGQRYSVNLVPRQPAKELFRTWAPLLEQIGKRSGLCFDIRIYDGFKQFESAMLEGESDFIFLNPYHQLMVHDTSGYLPLVRDRDSRLAGVLVVRADSPIEGISQLEDQTVAFPAPNAYVASLLMRALLAKKGIEIKPKYVTSHSNVLRSVALEAVDAGGAANNILAEQPESLMTKLRILYQSPFYIPHPFSAHPRVEEADREKVIQGFIYLTTSAEGRRMLVDIQMPHPIRADFERDYRELENLGLELFVVPISEIENP